jgi:hypothetical protein
MLLGRMVAGGICPWRACDPVLPRDVRFDVLRVDQVEHLALFHALVLCWCQCASVLWIHVYGPRCINGNRGESATALVVHSHRRSKRAAFVRYSMSSAIGFRRTTRIAFISLSNS